VRLRFDEQNGFDVCRISARHKSQKHISATGSAGESPWGDRPPVVLGPYMRMEISTARSVEAWKLSKCPGDVEAIRRSCGKRAGDPLTILESEDEKACGSHSVRHGCGTKSSAAGNPESEQRELRIRSGANEMRINAIQVGDKAEEC